MIEDVELLRRYANERSETAFAELVHRHINLVYASALRRVGGDTHLAKDVTQNVFTALAFAAAKVSFHPVLTGWLHTTTKFSAAQILRTERRRRAHEEEAHAMHESSLSDPSELADWERLQPLLDEVLDELNERDREAVLLRYIEGRSFAELSLRLQLTENTARMRVERALDKMGGMLARRGVTSTVAALALALTNQTGVAAPAGLAATVIGAALSGVAAMTGATAGMIFMAFMNSTKIVVGTAGIITALAVGTVLYQAKVNHEALTTIRRERDEALARIHRVAPAIEAEKARAEAADKDSTALLAVIDQMKEANETAPKVPVTHDTVQTRYQRAQELDRNGNWEAALLEYLWCYDEGMVRVSSFSGVRSSFLLGNVRRLAAHYPPALAALHGRRDSAEQRMLASESDREAAMDFASLNRELGEQERNLTTFDKLPVGDSRSQLLLELGGVTDLLIAARRYGDIGKARTYDAMKISLAMNMAVPPLPAGTADNLVEMHKIMSRKRVVTITAKDIEVLAGTGKLDQARDLTDKLFAYDSSDETRRIVQEHVTHAGHPDLLDKP